jgi:hypothetical protein
MEELESIMSSSITQNQKDKFPYFLSSSDPIKIKQHESRWKTIREKEMVIVGQGGNKYI